MIAIPREFLLRVAVVRADGWDGGRLWRAATPGDRRDALARPWARRMRFLLGRALIRHLLPVPGWRIAADASGRPRLAAPGWDVSFSHSGRFVAVAVVRGGAVGVDVEAKRPRPNAQAVAEAYFSKPECRAVRRGGGDALLAFWTMREAVGKGCGAGLSAALGLDGGPLAKGRGRVRFVAASGRDWIVGHRDLGGCHLAVAWAPPTGGSQGLLLRQAAAAISGASDRVSSRGSPRGCRPPPP